MKKVVLDISGCKHLHELHRKIKVALDFPDYYGENLSAFWDCINRECDADFVTVVGSSTVDPQLKPTMSAIIEMLEENKQYWANTDCPFDYEIVS